MIGLITVPYTRFKDDFYKYSGKITSPYSGRKIKVYFTSPDARKKAKSQDEIEKTKNKKKRKSVRSFLKWKVRIKR